jgi:glycosyltransferase involved in cell wall biosynthesis
MSVPLLSLCLIARDEETSLGRCLASARSVVDELVVVDTGSRDHTAEVARAAGARLESLPWSNDFAAARNFSLSLAASEWILVLDADEELEVADPAGFRSFLASATADFTRWNCSTSPRRRAAAPVSL